MDISQKDEQYLILTPTFEERAYWLMGTVGSFLGIVLFSFFFSDDMAPPVFFILVAITVNFVGIFYFVRNLFGQTIVIDKGNNTIIVTERNYLLSKIQRTIPFSEISGVVTELKIPWNERGTIGNKKWKVSFETIGKNIQIAHTKNEQGMWSLAHEICEFIGTEVVEKSGQFTTRSHPNLSRNQAVKNWQSRIQRESEGKKT